MLLACVLILYINLALANLCLFLCLIRGPLAPPANSRPYPPPPFWVSQICYLDLSPAGNGAALWRNSD